MSTTQSIEAKQRWETCREIANVLGCGKTHVHDRLYSRMKTQGLIDVVLDGNEHAIEEVKSWPEFSDVRESGWTPRPEEEPSPTPPTVNGKSKAAQAVERLKLTAWFIEKVGGIDKARKALEIVATLSDEIG